MSKKEKNKSNNNHDELIRVRVKANLKIIEKKEDKREDETAGIIEAYVSVFNNLDLDGDIIMRGAFTDSLKVKYPKGVWMHDWSIPIAKTLKAEEDDEGLLIRAQFNLETQRGKEAFSDIRFGIIDEFSIGFKILDFEWDENDNRVIKKVKLYEWSPVLAGANPKTRLLYAKNLGKADYIDVDYKKERAKIYFSNGRLESIKLSNKYITYLKSLEKQKGVKVEAQADNQKILRIRQAVKQADKACEFILRITK